MRKKTDDSVRITSATVPRSQDIAARQRRYLFSMSIRTVCFILAIVFRNTPAWPFFIAGAIILPYVAVVLANAGASPDPGGMDVYVPERPELETDRGTRSLDC
ncbi:DUF3099 domain-containing protein [Nocardioides marmoribigeumensis]|uniref:Membrane protein n=1 Tax=Nocardioides marmoribigeumensis TaxID=433649 RepID=A0ABU2C1F2_9ACTN|nr:DUF3099 domain-containing protein [Nocardioides marmoribigeumensis]MDR7364459.1 putative membrane protein [Nocardioides marmoribigeumensis]